MTLNLPNIWTVWICCPINYLADDNPKAGWQVRQWNGALGSGFSKGGKSAYSLTWWVLREPDWSEANIINVHPMRSDGNAWKIASKWMDGEGVVMKLLGSARGNLKESEHVSNDIYPIFCLRNRAEEQRKTSVSKSMTTSKTLSSRMLRCHNQNAPTKSG